jgi:hypothetical protein
VLGSSPEAFAASFYRDELAQWAKLVREAVAAE